ncbi:MAG TPA: sigma-70 family RNA polymerase sigma factor [Chloroflexota bacterium]|jgi:RNA polymerase sigma factor (sigma-70 family)
MTDRATTGATEAEELALRRLILGRYDDEAARVVIGRVVPRLAAFLRGRFPALAPEDAEDLAGEALTVAMERRDVFDPDRDTKVTTWLHGIAKLRAADLFRKRIADARLAEEWEGDEEEPGAARRHAAAVRRATAERYPAPPLDPALERAIRAAIADLPEQQRRAAEAHYLDGRAPRDVDEQYGWRPNTANVYLSHARRAMRRRLSEVAALPTPAGSRSLPRARGPVALAGGGMACPTRLRASSRRGLRIPIGAIADDAVGLALVA